MATLAANCGQCPLILRLRLARRLKHSDRGLLRIEPAREPADVRDVRRWDRHLGAQAQQPAAARLAMLFHLDGSDVDDHFTREGARVLGCSSIADLVVEVLPVL